MSLPASIYRALVPMRWRSAYRACANLLGAHGLYKSFSRGILTPDGQPLPWITFPCITYLLSLDLSHKRVFEFGCGASTKFWARIAREVVSVEGNQSWYQNVKPTLPANASIFLPEDSTPEKYVLPLTTNPGGKFDVIFIDGWHRNYCAKISPDYLADDGIIIHDNTDWYQETRQTLLTFDLIPVDFFGFIPGSVNTGITSIYFKRAFSLKPVSMPPWIPGGLNYNHENQTVER